MPYIDALSGVFGAEYAWNADEPESTTTTVLPILTNKVVLTTPTLTGGVYKICWSYGWSLSTNSKQFVGRVSYGGNGNLNRDTDGATEVHFVTQKPANSGNGELYHFGGFWTGVFPPGAITMRLQYSITGTGGGTATAFCRRARLDIQRVL